MLQRILWLALLPNAFADPYLDGSCPIFALLPFTSSYKIPESIQVDNDVQFNPYASSITAMRSFSYAAAASMAVQHFNSRDASVVPEIMAFSDCNIYLPELFIADSQGSPDASVRALYAATGQGNQPCAVLEPLFVPSSALEPSLRALNIPLMNYHEPSSSSISVSTALSLDGRAKSMIEFLREREFLAFYHDESHQALAEKMKELSKDSLQVEIFEATEQSQNLTAFEHRKHEFARIAGYGITTIYLGVAQVVDLLLIADVLDDLNMLEAAYTFILPPFVAPRDAMDKIYGELPKGSALDKLLSGALVYDVLDPWTLKTDKFLTAWKSQSSDLVEILNTLLPVAWLRANPTYFQQVLPSPGASFVYDTIMSIGMGACAANLYKTSNPDDNSTDSSNGDTGTAAGGPPPGFQEPPGLRVVNDTMVQQRRLQKNTEDAELSQSYVPGSLLWGVNEFSFSGASGKVRFQEGQRVAHDITIGLFNIRPMSDKPSRSYNLTLTAYYETRWHQIGEIFRRDGTSSDPTDYRYYNENFLSQQVRAVGLFLMGISWLMAILCMIALRVFQKTPIVQRAQPFFMQILCFGSIVMSTTILTLSFDENAGWSDRSLDIACAMSPWFFFTGQIMMFCALFTKLWRVDKVLQFRRTAVKVSHVIGPLIGFLVVTSSILVVWTAIDPWLWSRELVNEMPAERYGQCTSDHQWAFFGTLIPILFVAECLTMYFAWKTADVPEDFRDSGAVMYACFAQIQAWLIGVPMLAVLGDSSADATYFGRVFLVWFFAISGVGVVVAPKIYKAIRIRLNPELGNKKGRVKVTGVYHTYNPSAASSVSRPGLDSAVSYNHSTRPSNISNISKISLDAASLLAVDEARQSSDS